MNLIFVHGAPATGKLTTAKELLKIIPGRLFDNHVAIDTALTVFDFGAPGFWELVHEVRCLVVEAAAKQRIPTLAMTYCYSDSDRQQLDDFEEILQKYNGEFLPVHIRCDRKEVLSRLENPDRVQRGKIIKEKGLNEFAVSFEQAPVPKLNRLDLDSTKTSAVEMARAIVSHFSLR